MAIVGIGNDMEREDRIVMLAGLGDSTRIVYNALARAGLVDRVIIEEPVSKRQLLERRAKKLGKVRALSQAAFARLVVPALRIASRRRIAELARRIDPSGAPIPDDKIVHVPSVNSDACIRALVELRPRVVVVNGTRIIGEKLLGAVGATFINIHAGVTPRYRGCHGAYWARAEGRPEVAGVTVHLVDKGIDTGSILGQAIVEADARDTFVTLPYLQLEAGLPVLIDVVRKAARGDVATIPSIDGAGSKLWYHPTLGEYAKNWLKRGVR